MVAINKILLPECTGEGCGGDNNICTDSRVHRGGAENRAPVTRNHRSAPILGRWPARDPIGYEGGINLYGYVNSSPVGNVDAAGMAGPTVTAKVTAKATDNPTKNSNTPNVSVGVKCEVKVPSEGGYPAFVASMNAAMDDILGGNPVEKIDVGLSTDNPTGPDEAVSAGVTQVGGHTVITGQFHIGF
jgi:hypothetical protein